MSRLERIALSIIIYAMSCAGSLQGQKIAVRFWGPMLRELGAIADTAHIEHYRCLLGTWQGDTLYIVAAYEPQIIAATALFVSTGPCPPLLSVAEWHNHIPRQITAMGEDRGQVWPVEAYCELSPIDRRAEDRPDAPLFQLISVTKDVSCAWVLQAGHYARIEPWPPPTAP